jgi:hypothetical protein
MFSSATVVSSSLVEREGQKRTGVGRRGPLNLLPTEEPLPDLRDRNNESGT